jgi:periplasmic protein TonB
MLAYAAHRPVAGKRPSSPPAMLLIISAHVALIALVMSAKMEFQRKPTPQPPLINIPIERPPPPIGLSTKRQQPTNLPLSNPQPNVPLPHPGPTTVDPGPSTDPGPIALGGASEGFPTPAWPIVQPVRHEPRLLTRPDELKPPYPESKILSEQEATLQLRLTINDSGRVTAVDPIGAADSVFLEAARRYLIAHWRYQPATEDGRAIGSSVVISLHFQLDG